MLERGRVNDRLCVATRLGDLVLAEPIQGRFEIVDAVLAVLRGQCMALRLCFLPPGLHGQLHGEVLPLQLPPPLLVRAVLLPPQLLGHLFLRHPPPESAPQLLPESLLLFQLFGFQRSLGLLHRPPLGDRLLTVPRQGPLLNLCLGRHRGHPHHLVENAVHLVSEGPPLTRVARLSLEHGDARGRLYADGLCKLRLPAQHEVPVQPRDGDLDVVQQAQRRSTLLGHDAIRPLGVQLDSQPRQGRLQAGEVVQHRVRVVARVEVLEVRLQVAAVQHLPEGIPRGEALRQVSRVSPLASGPVRAPAPGPRLDPPRRARRAAPRRAEGGWGGMAS